MKNLVDQLQNLNFTQYESRAYLSLLEQGNITGYELAKNSGIPASKIYAVLNKLMEKEVVLAHDAEPIRYTPIPPKDVLSRLRGEYTDTLDHLDKQLSELYNGQKENDNYIWNISGREAIIRKVEELIRNAKRMIFLSIWDEEVEAVRKCLLAANERSVNISVVHFGESVLGVGNEYRHGREHKIREQRGARRISLEVDEEKVILGHFLKDGSSNAVWTTNKGLVLLAKDYIIHDIYTIRMAEKFGDQANEIFESI